MGGRMTRALRALLRIAPPRVTRERATEIARAECARNGWSWLEPVGIQEHLRTYSFWTNANARGGNAYVVVDIHDGRVRRKGFNPR
jgi:hypothetical protein